MNIQSIFNIIKQPFIDVNFYKDSIKKPFFRSFGILSGVILLMAFLSGYVFTVKIVPNFLNTSSNLVSELSDIYPDDLTFNWNGQNLESNTESLSVAWPSFISSESKEVADFPTDFLYFHNSDKTPGELDINHSEFLLVLNSSNLYHTANTDQEEWKEQSLQTLIQPATTFSVNKDSVTLVGSQIINFINNNVTQIKIAFFVAFSIAFYFRNFWFLIIETLLTILLFKLYSLKLTAKQTILLTTHVMIPTVVLNTVAELMYGGINFPLKTITFWLLIIFISFQFKKKSK
jgi:hypothetical protein